jgi:5-formyltetrahydrofolate cyclo-ligase
MKAIKKALREAVRKAAAGCAPVDGNLIAQSVEQLPEFAAAHTVALYHALPDEVSTAEMLARWRGVKRLALPVLTGEGTMVFREYTGEESLGAGAFGIAEPRVGREIPPSEIDLMLIPGVAFDAAGRRLGRGGGFYDRYLAQADAAHIYKVGLCRPRALVPKVPAEPHDIIMDKIIT